MRFYDLLLGDRRHNSARKTLAMADIPPTKPLFTDDSWGLLLVPIFFCVALLVSALVWL
jgi:hypothetical protein